MILPVDPNEPTKSLISNLVRMLLEIGSTEVDVVGMAFELVGAN